MGWGAAAGEEKAEADEVAGGREGERGEGWGWGGFFFFSELGGGWLGYLPLSLSLSFSCFMLIWACAGARPQKFEVALQTSCGAV